MFSMSQFDQKSPSPNSYIGQLQETNVAKNCITGREPLKQVADGAEEPVQQDARFSYAWPILAKGSGFFQ